MNDIWGLQSDIWRMSALHHELFICPFLHLLIKHCGETRRCCLWPPLWKRREGGGVALSIVQSLQVSSRVQSLAFIATQFLTYGSFWWLVSCVSLPDGNKFPTSENKWKESPKSLCSSRNWPRIPSSSNRWSEERKQPDHFPERHRRLSDW